jgi:hypothetical protein
MSQTIRDYSITKKIHEQRLLLPVMCPSSLSLSSTVTVALSLSLSGLERIIVYPSAKHQVDSTRGGSCMGT